MLFEKGIEVLHSKILIAGSDPFGHACEKVLADAGAIITRHDATKVDNQDYKINANCDAILVVEHNNREALIRKEEDYTTSPN